MSIPGNKAARAAMALVLALATVAAVRSRAEPVTASLALAAATVSAAAAAEEIDLSTSTTSAAATAWWCWPPPLLRDLLPEQPWPSCGVFAVSDRPFVGAVFQRGRSGRYVVALNKRVRVEAISVARQMCGRDCELRGVFEHSVAVVLTGRGVRFAFGSSPAGARSKAGQEFGPAARVVGVHSNNDAERVPRWGYGYGPKALAAAAPAGNWITERERWKWTR